jgi:hypothetical protein
MLDCSWMELHLLKTYQRRRIILSYQLIKDSVDTYPYCGKRFKKASREQKLFVCQLAHLNPIKSFDASHLLHRWRWRYPM